jgi:hypothetical protein
MTEMEMKATNNDNKMIPQDILRGVVATPPDFAADGYGAHLVKDCDDSELQSRFHCRGGAILPMIPDLSDEALKPYSTGRGRGSALEEETASHHEEKSEDTGQDATLTLLRDIAKGTENHRSDDDDEESQEKKEIKPQTQMSSNENPNPHSRLLSSQSYAQPQPSRMPSIHNFQHSLAGRCLSTVSYNMIHSRWGSRVFNKTGASAFSKMSQGSVAVDVECECECEYLPNALSSLTASEGEGDGDGGNASEFLPADGPLFASEEQDDLFQGFVLRQDYAETETLSLDESSVSASCNSTCNTKPPCCTQIRTRLEEPSLHADPPTTIANNTTSINKRSSPQQDHLSNSDVVDNNHDKECCWLSNKEAKEVSDWCDQEANIHAAMKDLKKGAAGHSHKSPLRVVDVDVDVDYSCPTHSSPVLSQGKAFGYTSMDSPSSSTHHEYSMRNEIF